jgi:hypothetical protein
MKNRLTESHEPPRLPRPGWRPAWIGAGLLCCLALAGQSAQAASVIAQPVLVFDTELTSLDLTALNGHTFDIPLGRAMGGGYQNVTSQVEITLSSMHGGMRSFGMANVFTAPGTASLQPSDSGPFDPNQHQGETFRVDSFFDVFFDITLTDVDPLHPLYASGTPVLPAMNIGPSHMDAQYSAVFDKNAPNFGLIPPPQSAPYIGHIDLSIPLGFDVDGDGINDKIKFSLAQHATVDGTRTFITLPNGTVVDSFNSNAALDGAVMDVSPGGDPPFTIGMTNPTGPTPGIFGGPVTATSTLITPLAGVPEPSSLLLLMTGAAGLWAFGRKRLRLARTAS